MKTNANDIPSTRRSRSGAVGYVTVPNAMPASQAAAPYLGRTRISGSYSLDDVARRIAAAKGAPMGVEEIKRVWNGTGGYLLDRLPEEPCAFDLVFARVRPAIGGKFPSVDAPFDAERNRLFVAVAPSDEIRNALSDGAPSKVDGSEGELEIGGVEWDGKAMTVKSDEDFTVLGNGLTLSSGDESADMELPDGDKVSVTLTPVESGN